jgi:hypothetical protein
MADWSNGAEPFRQHTAKKEKLFLSGRVVSLSNPTRHIRPVSSKAASEGDDMDPRMAFWANLTTAHPMTEDDFYSAGGGGHSAALKLLLSAVFCLMLAFLWALADRGLPDSGSEKWLAESVQLRPASERPASAQNPDDR